MPIGITQDHEALRQAALGFFARAAPVSATRDQLEALGAGQLPAAWPELVTQGLLSVHLPEPAGGGGGTLVDLAVVAEAAGSSLFPGPFVPTVLTSALVARATNAQVQHDTLGALVSGVPGATALSRDGVRAEHASDGLRLYGRTGPVLGLPGAQLLVVGATTDDGERWTVVDLRRHTDVVVRPGTCTDLTCGIGTAEFDGLALAPAEVLEAVTTADVRYLAAVLFCAQVAGAVRWCLENVTGYVRQREAFGRPVGSFQAVKHRCARLFIECEKLAASAWDAARADSQTPAQQALAGAAAAVTCLEPARDAALDALTLLGGIGFTWEHDVHLYWRRCLTLAQLLGRKSAWEGSVGRAAAVEARDFSVPVTVDDDVRQTMRAMAGEIASLAPGERRGRMAELGLVSPQYPPPFGRSAMPAEQLMITEELQRAGLEQPRLIIGEWALPTLIAHGTPEQQQRFVPPSLRGEITWCQLFSEPGAGSDLAALRTRAVPVDGGWIVNGQKVWTSLAHVADWGLCLARTDPAAPRHRGISYFLVDMHAPGVEVRPLRQSTGSADFNEVFLTDVFVPDDCLVGEVNAGWSLAMTTLGNERVQMADLATWGPDPVVLARAASPDLQDDEVAQALGRVLAERICLVAMSTRSLLRRMSGLRPGSEASALKLAGSWHSLSSARAMLDWVGPEAVGLPAGPGTDVVRRYLATPSQLLGGGTAEIQLNVIAERVLGLPKS